MLSRLPFCEHHGYLLLTHKLSHHHCHLEMQKEDKWRLEPSLHSGYTNLGSPLKSSVALGALPYQAAVSFSANGGHPTAPGCPCLRDHVFTASIPLPLLLGFGLFEGKDLAHLISFWGPSAPVWHHVRLSSNGCLTPKKTEVLLNGIVGSVPGN